jgi:hypothetical protein
MPRTVRLALLVPAVLALLNLVALLAAGSPCLPSSYPCIEG